MKATLLLLSIVILTGCVSSTKTYAPDGRKAFSINCGFAILGGACYEKAGEICTGKGYEIIAKNGEQAITIACKE